MTETDLQLFVSVDGCFLPCRWMKMKMKMKGMIFAKKKKQYRGLHRLCYRPKEVVPLTG